MKKDREKVSHESFGLIGISRRQGRSRLFGSDINHHSTIAIRISRAYIERDLHRTWTYEDGRLIEIEMSHAQFAELITTPNIGSGVPCTIGFVKGEGLIDPPPEITTERDLNRDEFRQRLSRIESELRDTASRLSEIMEEGKRPTMAEIREMVGLCERMANQFASNSDFAVKSFEEAIDKTVTHAKAEFEAFVENKIRQTGLESLAQDIRLLKD